MQRWIKGTVIVFSWQTGWQRQSVLSVMSCILQQTRPEIVGSDIWAQLMRFLYSMDAADNLFPSIHCLVSWLCYIGIRGNKKVPQWIRTTFCICAIAVFISTLTTKQHVIYDVVAGVILIEVTYRISRLLLTKLSK